MKPYRIYPSERTSYEDRVSGQTVHKLTGYLGHSVHPYFTDDGWFDGDRKMLFQSDRGNVRNMFCIDIESGEIMQLTDMPAGGKPASFPMQVNHVKNETYYTHNGCVYAISLDTLETRPLYIPPKGFGFGGARPTADGKYVLAGLTEDLSHKIKANLSAGYIGMRDIFEAKPDCRIMRINVETNEVDEIWQEYCWVGHINPSPAHGNLLTFCHEGPWQLVDHRIWVLDMDTGKATKLRERKQEGEMVGHEYWFRDGIHVGYQVHQHDEKGDQHSLFGFAKYDGTGETEAGCIRYPGPDHIHSNGFEFFVADSGKHIKGYKFNGKDFDGPRIICMHDGSFDWGAHHPHPSMTRDGKSIIYNSTAAGYCNVYQVGVPEDFNALPEVEMPK
jgi:oligogalacturonide lyase